MRRSRFVIAVVSVSLVAACGGGSDDGSTTSTTLGSVKDVVRQQLDAVVTSYVNNMTTQMPTITSKTNASDITACAKERVSQMIDAVEPQPNQPESEFASTLLSQVQSSLYGIIGACAQVTG